MVLLSHQKKAGKVYSWKFAIAILPVCFPTKNFSVTKLSLDLKDTLFPDNRSVNNFSFPNGDKNEIGESSEERKFLCDQCPGAYKDRKTLRRHIQVKNGANISPRGIFRGEVLPKISHPFRGISYALPHFP
jgi:hypothetical protein